MAAAVLMLVRDYYTTAAYFVHERADPDQVAPRTTQ